MASENAILAEGLRKDYITYVRRGFFRKRKRVIHALRGVSFRVRWGEVFGLLGPNGAGKTTTVKIITTLLLPDGGNALVNGFDVVKDPIKVRESIGVVLNVERGFFWKLTGRENLKYFGMLRGLKGKDLEEAIDKVVKLVGLDELKSIDKLYEEYSLGMKARLALARALLHDPPILILDEPTLGLDPPAAREIRELLVRLAKKEGKAVMITTHNMFEAEIICDYVAIISSGTISAQGTVHELKRLVADKIPVSIKFSGKIPANLNDVNKLLFESTLSPHIRIKEIKDGFEARILVDAGDEEKAIASSINALVSKGFTIRRAEVVEPSLEDVFIAVTKGDEKNAVLND